MLGHLGRLLARPRDGAAHILFGLAVLLLIRSFVEVDILYPYTIGSFLIYYAAGQIPVLAGNDRQAARRRETEGPAGAARFRSVPRAVRID